ncbi:MAG TPA: hypothetical protein VMY42_23620 [Thermoguttaceae bacterium]|nr:hypothetical protein [Thermoguttaceae bacterium]
MNLSQTFTDLLGRVLRLEGTEAITDYEASFAARWAAEGPAWLLFGCVALAVAAIVFYARFQRQKHAMARTVLAMLRGGALCLLLLMLAEPILTATVTSEKRPLLWILVDGTDSMNVRDQYDEEERAKLAEAAGLEDGVEGRGARDEGRGARDEGLGTRDEGREIGTDDPAHPLAPRPSPLAPRPSPLTPSSPARIDYVKGLFRRADDNLLAKLAEKARLQVFLFDSAHGVRSLKLSAEGGEQLDGKFLAENLTATGKVSALGTALDDLAQRNAASSLGGLIVLSDFNRNTGKKPVEAAKRLGAKIYAVGIGATKAVDVSVALDASPIMKKDERESVAVNLQISQHEKLEGESVKVTLLARRFDAADRPESEEIPIGEKVVELSGPSLVVPFPYIPDKKGKLLLRAEVEPLGREAVHENNVAEREITVRDDFLRLLFVEYEPTWEWRFIKEVFHRDKLVGMEGFRTFLRESDPRVKHSNPMFLPTMTLPRSEFFANDVIFLGDLPATALSPGFCQMTEEFVREFGGGLVILSGPKFGPAQLIGTELEKMLPVKFDPRAGFSAHARVEERQPFRLQLTPWAQRFDFMQLGSGEDENARAWDNLGPLPWYVRVDGLHSDTLVLAEHPEDPCVASDEGGLFDGGEPLLDQLDPAAGAGSRTPTKQPLIAIRKYGAGEVVYLGFNETWRMRRQYGERYYRQFWGQMIHRLGLSHALGSQKRFVVETDRRHYRADDQVLLTVDAYTEDYQPLTEARLLEILQTTRPDLDPKLSGELILPGSSADAENATNAIRVQPLSLTQVRSGVFQTEFPVFADGQYLVRVTDPVTGEPVEAAFQVKTDETIERRSPNRDLTVQQSIAAANPGGMSLEFAEVNRLLGEIDLTPKIETDKRILSLWNNWLFFGCVVGLLLSEWLLRKWVNLP